MVDGTLLISSVISEDSGNYTCMPTNGLLTPPTASANLTVMRMFSVVFSLSFLKSIDYKQTRFVRTKIFFQEPFSSPYVFSLFRGGRSESPFSTLTYSLYL